MEMLHIPNIGCDITASVACLDNLIFKHVLTGENLLLTKYVVLERRSWKSKMEVLPENIQQKNVELLLFVKPCSLGSSLGIFKVSKWEGLPRAVEAASQTRFEGYCRRRYT